MWGRAMFLREVNRASSLKPGIDLRRNRPIAVRIRCTRDEIPAMIRVAHWSRGSTPLFVTVGVASVD